MRRDALELAGDSLFIEKIRNTFRPQEAELFARVYAFSKKKGAGQNNIPFRAANIIIEHGSDASTVSAAMLAPVLLDARTTTNEIRKEFGSAVAAAVEAFTIPSVPPSDTESQRRRDIHSILVSFAKNPHKALIIIAVRLAELEDALENQRTNSRRLAHETLDLYVPIANQLGFGGLRRRLEDVCFHILESDEYDSLKNKVAPIQAEDDKCLQILTEGVKRLLDKNGSRAEIQGRTKSLHGIHRKMIRTGKSLDEIMDRIGMRIIVASVPECYTVLGLLHTHFKPIAGTFDDYIGLPKANGYQSLHTCVYPVREISHKPIEFQIRTKLMHSEAEHGAAAHWLYKSVAAGTAQDYGRAQWMEGLARQHAEAESDEAFIELLHRQVFRDHVVVFGNGGRIVRLAEKATVRDYLNITNIEAPQGAVVKVNGRTTVLDHFLRDGDSIEVLVGDAPNGPLEKEANKSDLPSTLGPAHPYGLDWYDAKLMRPTSRRKAQEN